VSVKKHKIKYASKVGIGLAMLKAFREFLLAVRVLGLLLAVLGSKLLLAVLSSKLLLAVLLLVHSVGYDTHKQSQ
jgi:hypothetical protein